jgi:hypothetical protein
MNLEFIVSELKKERDRIDRAIAALDGTHTERAVAPAKASSSERGRVSRKHRLSAAGRKRLSELMKRRWAERRRKTSNRRNSGAKAA